MEDFLHLSSNGKHHFYLYPNAWDLVTWPYQTTREAGKYNLLVGPERIGNGFSKLTKWVQNQRDLGSNSSSERNSHVSLHASISLSFKG